MTTVPAQRILRGVTADLSVTFLDQDGEPAAGGTVTVDVSKADGTVIATGASTSAGDGTGEYTYSLAAQASLELITAVWKDDGNSRITTVHEVVGGYFFSVTDARAFDGAITTDLATDARILAVRREVEDECELITEKAWVPRFRRIRADGTGTPSLFVGDWALRSLRSARVYTSGTDYEAFTATELAAVQCTEWGEFVRTDGGSWPTGTQNIVLEYEHGYDRPPADLQHGSLTRLRSRLQMETSGIPDRATSFTVTGGGVFSIATPGRAGFETGIPEVDAVYRRYGRYA